jgi:hypothetical protein
MHSTKLFDRSEKWMRTTPLSQIAPGDSNVGFGPKRLGGAILLPYARVTPCRSVDLCPGSSHVALGRHSRHAGPMLAIPGVSSGYV